MHLNTPPVERLGIPALRTCDAPEGVRDGTSTSFPMGIVMASTWNPALIGQVGAAIGRGGEGEEPAGDLWAVRQYPPDAAERAGL